MKYAINFFTVATGKYKDFILPYIVSVLHFNKNSFVEIMTDDVRYLSNDIAVLNILYRGRFKIYNISPKHMLQVRNAFKMASLRFVTKPTVYATLTYIGDVDILILDGDIAQRHTDHMNRVQLPYSNMKRLRKKRLSGLHCVNTKEYYSKIKNLAKYETLTIQPPFLDEHLLYKIVADNFGVPKSIWQETNGRHWFRPTHGLHCSLNREISTWVKMAYKAKFVAFYKTKVWKTALKHTKPWYRNAILQVCRTFIGK